MQTFHANTRSCNATKWAWTTVICRNQGIALGCVTFVCIGNELWVDLGFCLVYATCCFKATYQHIFACTT